jgi:hypothetical protein
LFAGSRRFCGLSGLLAHSNEAKLQKITQNTAKKSGSWVVAGPILGPKWLAWLGQLPSHFSSKILN